MMRQPEAAQARRGAISSRAALVLASIALAALLIAGVSRLFGLRYSRGDVFPAYSTLRADPLGAKAIHDALDAMPGFDVSRNFRPLVRLKPEQPITLVYLGIDFDARWGDDELPEFESMVTTGTRAVFAFQREFKTTSTQRLSPAKKAKASATPTPAPGGTPAPKGSPAGKEELPGIGFDEVARRWGFAFDIAQDEDKGALHAKAEREPDADELDASLPWHSALYFKGLSPKWRVLYRCNGVPVIIERDFGRGSIVLASDSFFLSNEALRHDRAAKLIAHLIGPPRRVVFDEEHHGVTEDMNLVGLARKHGLEGAVAAIAFVLGLVIWRAATLLLPRRALTARSEADVLGADAGEGFVNLLRRSIPPRRILAVCVEEWRKARGRRLRAEENAHVDSVLRAHEGRGAGGSAAAAYRTIAEGLARR